MIQNFEKLNTLIASGTLAKTIEEFGHQLAKRLKPHPNVARIRQYGLTAIVEMAASDGQPEWSAEARMGWQVCLAARAHSPPTDRHPTCP